MAPKQKRQGLTDFEKVWLAKKRVKYSWTYQQLREAYWREFGKDASEWPSGFVYDDLRQCRDAARRQTNIASYFTSQDNDV